MSIENCKNLLYKRGPVAIAFAIGAVVATTATILLVDPANQRLVVLPAVRPTAFFHLLGPVPAAVRHVQVHVRAVRRKHDPKPKAPTQATISLYESTTSPRVFREQGCGAAKRGATGVVILDFGKPAYNGHTYGTILFSGAFAGNKEITRAMLGYAEGYASCLARGSDDHIHLARGTSNYHPSVPNVYKAGRKWARETMQLQRELGSLRLDRFVTSAAADDV